MKKVLCLMALWSCFEMAYSQEKVIILNWTQNQKIKFSDTEETEILSFEGATHDVEHNYLPLWFLYSKNESSDLDLFFEIKDIAYSPLSSAEELLLNKYQSFISDSIQVSTVKGLEQKTSVVLTYLLPFRKNSSSGRIEKISSFSYSLNKRYATEKISPPKNRTSLNESVLKTGDWYKIGITENGIYKLDNSFFSSLGIDISTIDPYKIRLFGNGGGMLSLSNSAFRRDDLAENAIYVSGEADGKFNASDYVLFYGTGPNTWKADNTGSFSHQINLYSDTTYYFININQEYGKRIAIKENQSTSATNIVTSFDDYSFHNRDLVNLIRSGKNWYGEKFDSNTSYDFSFLFPNIDLSSPVFLKTNVAGRGSVNSNFTISSSGTSAIITCPPVDLSCYYCLYAQSKSANLSFQPISNTINVNIKYNKPNATAIGYLDFIEVNARRLLKMSGNQMAFRDFQSVGQGNIASFSLAGISSGINIWDVTDPTAVQEQEGEFSLGTFEFKSKADTLREYIAFTNQGYLTPRYFYKIPNQNLHGMSQKDMIILTHPMFLSEANEIAALHLAEGLTVAVVTNSEVYNEFSSGAPDITALRDLLKMFYDRANTAEELPKYLLLIGDGSYVNKRQSVENGNFILTYQSSNSLSPTESYASDDFFGLLDDNEGSWAGNNELVDIGIGRLPVKSVSELQGIINKIKIYTSSSSMKDWRNTICFVADDKDNSLHVNQADMLANYIESNHKSYNVDKIYFDAYPMLSTPGGQRYPQVNEDILKRIEKGALIMNYTGHGGEAGWAHERVLGISEINASSNINNLPLFFTATCEFSRFDDPSKTSPGEYLILNPKGGAIALFSTVRVVYASPNFTLNDNFFKSVFEDNNSNNWRMGDVFRKTKMASGGIVNNRNFTFLGDPALKLAYPEHSIMTTSINQKAINPFSLDTIKALEKISISGQITDRNGSKINNYNGILYPTVYDKSMELKTLGNDPASPVINYSSQRNILYKGKVSIKNGEFSYSFIVPKDIFYQYGKGKISYYASNGNSDGHGYTDDFILGGIADSVGTDNTGPQVNLYLNNDKFIFGGTTSENPFLFAKLEDENGINTTGNSIGHDLTAILDENTEQTIVLNDYYEAEMDSYQKGSIKYPFSKLSDGKHTLKIKVWDVYNNSNEAYTEFVVANSEEIALKHVLNYPNPFTTNTHFMFEHNQAGVMLNIQIQIMTMSGKVIKTINRSVASDGFRGEPIAWNGLDDFNEKIGKGVYIYKIKVGNAAGKISEKYEKLVILN